LQAPYCTGPNLVCKIGPNTCCEDNNGDGECDFECGGLGELCCVRENPQLGEEANYCESANLECVNGFCVSSGGGGEAPEMEYKGPIIETLEDILGPLTRILYFGGLFIGIFFVVYSGYRLMISQGNPRSTQEAQEQLTAAILGILFILLSATILRIIINNIFGGSIDI
jgi:hypothetical protein